MLDPKFAVTVLRSPFGVREADFVTPYDPDTAGGDVLSYTDAQVVNRYAQVQPLGVHPGNQTRRSYAVGNARGIQLLVANTRSSSLPGPAARSSPNRQNPRASGAFGAPARLQALSKHEDGRLLLWDAESGAVLASCLFQPDFTVRHSVATSSFVYNTLEASAAATGAEEETCVYVWERRALRSVTVMRGHTARLTALAVCPTETSTLVATASLDGTLRLWRHAHLPMPPLTSGDASGSDPVQTLWVLATAEIGTVHSLTFLSSDLLVIAGTRCTMAFVRFPDSPPPRRAGGSVVTADVLPFQTVTSNVDADGGTTFLHVCPFNRVNGTQPLSGGSPTSSPTKARSPSLSNSPSTPRTNSSGAVSPLPAPSYSLVYLLTGSTSGYVQEWVVDIGVDNLADVVGAGKPAYVGARCRWYHKAHCATVDCVVTDEDVVVSSSMFDGARLYHRKSGATCAITSTAAVPVLVPQRQEVVWGTIDGTVSVASYAHFACGAEKELHMLWSAKPHATAVRGVCLALTPDFRWDVLCTGAADGTMSVWRMLSEPGRMVSSRHMSLKEATTALFHRILHVLVVPVWSRRPPTGAMAGSAPVAAVVAGLRTQGAGKPNAVLIAEVTASGDVMPAAALPYKEGEDVTCAHVLRDGAGAMEVWVGTQSGLLLHSTKKAAQKAWAALTAVHWDAKPRGGVEAITAVPSSAGVVVAVAESADARQAAQRLFLSLVRLDPKAQAAETVGTVWEDSVTLPSTITASSRRHRSFGLTWVTRDEMAEPQGQPQKERMQPQAEQQKQPGASVVGGLLVCGSDGTLIRCTRATNPGAAAPAWQTPELLFVASSVGPGSAVQRNLDATPSSLSTTVAAESGTSDLTCVDVFSKAKRVLLPSKARMPQLTGPLCDGGSSKVRLVGVKQDGGEATSEALFFDDAGQMSYRVTYDGAVVLSSATAAAAGLPTAKEQLHYTPRTKKVATQRTSIVAAPAALVGAAITTVPCTAVAAHATERVVLLGYEDGLLQMVDTTDMYVFCRRWATDTTGTAQSILEVRYGGAGVAVARLENDEICTFVVPPRSLLDIPSNT